MKKPRQHNIETKSKKIFEALVPDEWNVVELHPDYGKDYMVEIFENEISTGKIFYVQLKGSDQKIKDNAFHLQMRVSHLKYFASISNPILLVFVSTTTDQVWAIWSNTLINSLRIDEKQQSVKMILKEKHIIDRSYFSKISGQIGHYNKLGISVTHDHKAAEMLHLKYQEWISAFYDDTVSVNYNNLPDHIKFDYEYKNEKITLRIQTNEGVSIIKIEPINDVTPYLLRPRFDETNINDFNKEFLFRLALGLPHHNIKSSLVILRKVIPHIDFKDWERIKKIDVFTLIYLATKQDLLHEVKELIKVIISHSYHDFYTLFDMAFVTLCGKLPTLKKIRIELLREFISTSKDSVQSAHMYYNLANSLRSESMHREALKYYFQTRKLEPDYLKREYWWIFHST